jgi:hypothetical protein
VTMLYVETNYLIGIATGRDPGLEPFATKDFANLRLAIPAICIFEAFSWWQSEVKRRRQFSQILQEQIIQLKRDRVSVQASLLWELLVDAVLKNKALLRSVEIRLFAAIDTIRNAAELIPSVSQTVGRSRESAVIDELTDNLILHTILDHAANSTETRKLFLSHNSTEFGGESVRQALRDSGVVKYFTQSQDVLGWLRSQPLF